MAYGEGVKGTFVREAPRVALSFIANEDSPIPGSDVQLRILGSGTDVAIDKVECADKDGAPLDGAMVSLGI